MEIKEGRNRVMFSLWLHQETRDTFKKYCRQNNLNMTEEIRKLMIDYLKERGVE